MQTECLSWDVLGDKDVAVLGLGGEEVPDADDAGMPGHVIEGIVGVRDASPLLIALS